MKLLKDVSSEEVIAAFVSFLKAYISCSYRMSIHLNFLHPKFVPTEAIFNSKPFASCNSSFGVSCIVNFAS